MLIYWVLLSVWYLKIYLFWSVALDLFSELDKCSGQGVMSYDISMSTLNDVFMKLEGKSTIGQGKCIVWLTENQFPNNHELIWVSSNSLHMIYTKECE